jgi:hypothetical protein
MVFEFNPFSEISLFDTTLCDKVCYCSAAGQWFSQPEILLRNGVKYLIPPLSTIIEF